MKVAHDNEMDIVTGVAVTLREVGGIRRLLCRTFVEAWDWSS